jgi:long-chain acyl-CoA synthetase
LLTGLLCQFLSVLNVGGTVYLTRRFRVSQCLQIMEENKITFFVGVPTVYIMMLTEIEKQYRDLSALRMAIYGGSALSEISIRGLAKISPTIQLFNGFGATETSAPCIISPSKDSLRKLPSIGIEISVVECRIMNDQGVEVPIGQSGELWVKGSTVIKGYWNNEEANRREFTEGY